MLIVKITALLIVITAILAFFVSIYLQDNTAEWLQIYFELKTPWYAVTLAILFVADAIGIIASAIYLLFLR